MLKYIPHLKNEILSQQLDHPQLIPIVDEHLSISLPFNFITIYTKGDILGIMLYCNVNMDPDRDREVADRGRRVAGRGRGRGRGVRMCGGRRLRGRSRAVV